MFGFKRQPQTLIEKFELESKLPVEVNVPKPEVRMIEDQSNPGKYAQPRYREFEQGNQAVDTVTRTMTAFQSISNELESINNANKIMREQLDRDEVDRRAWAAEKKIMQDALAKLSEKYDEREAVYNEALQRTARWQAWYLHTKASFDLMSSLGAAEPPSPPPPPQPPRRRVRRNGETPLQQATEQAAVEAGGEAPPVQTEPVPNSDML